MIYLSKALVGELWSVAEILEDADYLHAGTLYEKEKDKRQRHRAYNQSC
jgi:hypothetical protein